MEVKEDNSCDSYHIVNKNEKVTSNKNMQHFKYLYPNVHRSTPQMRWFKGLKDMDLKFYRA